MDNKERKTKKQDHSGEDIVVQVSVKEPQRIQLIHHNIYSGRFICRLSFHCQHKHIIKTQQYTQMRKPRKNIYI